MTDPVFTAAQLDQNGDLVLVTGEGNSVDLAVIDGIHEAEQSARIRLSTDRGEDPISPDVGIPVPDMVGLYDEVFVEAVIRQALADEARVDAVGKMTLTRDPETRIVTVDIPLRLTSGEDITVETDLGRTP